MAALAGWHPTRRIQYIIYYDEKELDNASGSSPQEAIKDWLKGYSEEYIQKHYNMSLAEFAQKLTAKESDQDEDDTDLTRKDIKSINSPKTRAKIEQWLNNNPLDYRIVVAFGSVEEHNLQPTPGVITFVKLGNAGGDVLTPHMILHTFGHAVGTYNRHQLIVDNMFTEIERILGPIRGRSGATREHDDSGIVIDLCKLLHMRAAHFTVTGSNRGFPTAEEVGFELIGIYTKNGNIKVSPNQYCDYPIGLDRCTKIRKIIEKYCQQMLNDCVGNIIMDD